MSDLLHTLMENEEGQRALGKTIGLLLRGAGLPRSDCERVAAVTTNLLRTVHEYRASPGYAPIIDHIPTPSRLPPPHDAT